MIVRFKNVCVPWCFYVFTYLWCSFMWVFSLVGVWVLFLLVLAFVSSHSAMLKMC